MKLFTLILCMAAWMIVVNAEVLKYLYKGLPQPTVQMTAQCVPFFDQSGRPLQSVITRSYIYCFFYEDSGCHDISTWKQQTHFPAEAGNIPIKYNTPPPQGIMCMGQNNRSL
ncbi:hypothetical protein BCR42DRAFT_396953 [Absidia repens]|uniref:Uncharacterized protein n=1 Tax=Absidia repens TaxID=90262 RepID=A0A1X2I2V7_9FUNG|nr:hypothetical protein BCR42DRAFT_396953 [Absidia repens]